MADTTPTEPCEDELGELATRLCTMTRRGDTVTRRESCLSTLTGASS